MILLLFEKHVLWTDGTRTFYLDQVTWIVAGLSFAWVVSFLVSRYLRRRALRRRPRRTHHKLPKRIIRVKRDLSSRYLRPNFSGNIHAVGIGRFSGSDDYYIQVFINDAAAAIWTGPGTLPKSYRGVPVVSVEMPRAVFLSSPVPASPDQFPNGIRERQETIIGGISGANTNLTGQSGTIGYFCTRKSKLPRRREIHLLSNSHVFADLRKAKADETDLIMQPSPGEPSPNRPIGTLVNFSAVKFETGTKDPNHVDAAIAKLWAPHRHNAVIPQIGGIKGHVRSQEIEVGEGVRKFGRTTGYTEGRIFSICLDIWIRYDRTGKSAFFQNQLLIQPALPCFAKFVAEGDSGSLVVDERQHAIGLIFGGMAKLPESLTKSAGADAGGKIVVSLGKPQRIESYGVANPISEVLDRLKIDLVV
ncbi:MAG TPA: hypothetical protein VGO56_03745 [Pyrinomonadaceae bacterium]|jgi:hypothetical protein|nr:hypothetical protein [Pyrinomonadaceae bacterium]